MSFIIQCQNCKRSSYLLKDNPHSNCLHCGYQFKILSPFQSITIDTIQKLINIPLESQDKNKLISLLLNPINLNEMPKIVVFGPMNSGKSSLLNMLVEQKDYFKVSDRKETVEIKENIFNQRKYIDTPGWHSDNIVDEEKAIQGLALGDVWIFNHSLIDGDLRESDQECLKAFTRKIATYEQCKTSLIITLSKCESITSEIQLNQIKEEISKQLSHLKIPYLDMISISSNRMERYLSLRQTDVVKSSVFYQKSGFIKLKQSIEQACLFVRSKRTTQYRTTCLQALQNLENSIQSKYQELINKQHIDQQAIHGLNQSRKDLKNRLKSTN
jgi:GTP-binding protein EngB required for normal cell division